MKPATHTVESTRGEPTTRPVAPRAVTGWPPFLAAGACVTACWLLAVLALPAASAPSAHAALRKLLKLPVLHAEFALRLDAENGYVISGGRKDPAPEIERVTKAMQGQPADAERHYQLFELYRQAGDGVRASNHLARSVALFRTLADSQSENALVLARYGRALDLARQDEQAEVVLRRAVRLGPKEWRGWSALGQLLLAKAWRALAADLTAETTARPELLLAAAARKQVSAAQLEKAQSDLKEAMLCADRAVAVAPEEAQPFADRALVHSYLGLSRFVQDILRGTEPDVLTGYQAMFPTNALADLERVARLAPQDPAALARIGLFRLLEAATGMGRRGMDQLGTGQLWHSLSDRQRQALRRTFTGLEDLGHNGNPTVAASALEFLGAFQWTTMRDHAGAEKSLRRAVQLDPSREMAWDFLMAVLVDADRKEESVAVAESRLKSKHTIRNFVAAAKAYDRAGRLDRAQSHLETALKLHPDDYLANLSAAIVLLKRRADDDTLRRAGALIERAGRVEGRPANRIEWVEWTLTAGIFFALSGETDGARREFKRILEAEPANQTAKDALAIVGP